MKIEITDNARINELLERVHQTSISKSVSASEWDEIMTYLEESLMTEERITKEYVAGKEVGERMERERIVKILENQASQLFLDSQDEEANRVRRLIRQIRTKDQI